MFLKCFIFFLFCSWATSQAAPASEKKIPVKIKLVKCSKTTGGAYRKGPQAPSLCKKMNGKFQILSGCENKYDPSTCKRVLKRNSKTGIYETKLSKGLYHFIWDTSSSELRPPKPCTLEISSAYDIEIQQPHQEVSLNLDQFCFAP